MIAHIRFITRYIRFLSSSGNEHSIHSPFVYDLYSSVIRPDKFYYVFNRIEELREKLQNSKKDIQVTDLGAGSVINNKKTRSLASIACDSGKSPRLARVIFRLVNHFKPSVIFDLGTSLGFTTLYEATPYRKTKVYTFEGCPETAAIAQSHFDTFRAKNIKLIQGNLDDTLAQAVKSVEKIDFVFFDANHRYQPTINYFNTCLEKAGTDTVFVFDDIHWSDEMEKAWEEIKAHPRVTLTIDLFYLGVVFFRTNQPKQHFKLRV